MALQHLPSRRELLISSGVLFAWAHLPKLALAEGRDPRFLTIVLRGALDGLGMVAPIGDPRWTGLRGNSALSLEGARPALPLDSFFALNPARLRSCMQSRRPIASARISMGKTCWKADLLLPVEPIPAGSIARSPPP